MVGGGGFSLEFPGGYCVKPGCDTNEDCPDGTGCLNSPALAMQGAPASCIALCSAPSDCRDGYECNTLPAIIGGDGTTYCLPPLPF
jgi:hypothetical protein